MGADKLRPKIFVPNQNGRPVAQLRMPANASRSQKSKAICAGPQQKYGSAVYNAVFACGANLQALLGLVLSKHGASDIPKEDAIKNELGRKKCANFAVREGRKIILVQDVIF